MTVAVRPPKRGKGPAVLAIVGGVALVAGIVAFVAGIILVGTAASDLVEDAGQIRDDLLVEVAVPGEGAVTLAEGRYYVYAIGPDSPTTATTAGPTTTSPFGDSTTTAPGASTTSSPAAVIEPEVSIEGPDGVIALSEPGLDVVFNGISVDLHAIGQFTVDRPGRHTVAVVAGASTVPRIGIGEVHRTDGVAEKGIGGSVLLLASTILGGLGFVLLLGGLIWLAVRASNRPPPPPAGPWGYGPSPGHGAPPGYGVPPGFGAPPGYGPPRG